MFGLGGILDDIFGMTFASPSSTFAHGGETPLQAQLRRQELMNMAKHDPAEEKLINELAREWSNMAVSTEPMNFEAATEAFGRLYELGGLPAPRIIRVGNPDELMRKKLMDREITPSALFDIFEHDDMIFKGLWAGYDDIKGRVRACLNPLNIFLTSRYASAPTADGLHANQWGAHLQNQFNQQSQLNQLSMAQALGSGIGGGLVSMAGTSSLPFQQFQGPRVAALKERRNLVTAADMCRAAAGFTYLIENGQRKDDWLPLIEAARHCFWALLYEKHVVICERPVRVRLNDQWQPHSDDGAAIAWGPVPNQPDMTKIRVSDLLNTKLPVVMRQVEPLEFFALGGVDVGRRVIMDPESFNAAEIMNEGNQEVRRLLISRYKGGPERWMMDAGGRILNQDEVGKLWRVERKWDTPFQMVEVLNSTPEPDGSIRTYFLRVPPTIRTAKEGIAWTFNMTEKEYNLSAQS